MRVIAAMLVDLHESAIGGASRLAEVLRGRTILRRTVERAIRAELPEQFHVVCPTAQRERVTALLDRLNVAIETFDAPPAPFRMLVRGGRYWGLDAWRGGPGSFCVFDEDFHTAVLEALARTTQADAIAVIPAAAPLFDPALLDDMIRTARGTDEPTGITFVQAPPGLGAFIVRRHILDQLSKSTIPPGAILAYQPMTPMADLTGRETCHRPALEIIHARGRLICDTRRAVERVTRLLDLGAESEDAAGIARRLNEEAATRVEPFPEEIEIELTTDVPSGWHPKLRAMGGDGPRRGPVDTATIQAIATGIRAYDDVRIVLGGFGEPLLHPQFPEICRILRAAGAMAIAVRTSGLVQSDAIDAALFETPVQLVEVMIDAATRETYQRVFGADEFENLTRILDGRLERRVKGSHVLPLWMPSLVKAEETFDDLEPFVDHWQRRLGMYCVTGYSHCAGQRADRAVSRMSPPERVPCRRTFSRMMVLADGRVTTCDQDFRGSQAVGDLNSQTVETIWHEAARLNAIRTTVIGEAPLCAECEEWHRP